MLRLLPLHCILYRIEKRLVLQRKIAHSKVKVLKCIRVHLRCRNVIVLAVKTHGAFELLRIIAAFFDEFLHIDTTFSLLL